jgi:hypothetical protein
MTNTIPVDKLAATGLLVVSALLGVMSEEERNTPEMRKNIDDLQKILPPVEQGDGYSYMKVGGADVRILEHARNLYNHDIAAWISDRDLAVTENSEIAPGDFYLVHWPGTRRCAVVHPAGNDQWRMQEFVADQAIENYMKLAKAWT